MKFVYTGRIKWKIYVGINKNDSRITIFLSTGQLTNVANDGYRFDRRMYALKMYLHKMSTI